MYMVNLQKIYGCSRCKGVKSANERFAGALDTYTIEAMMQDGKVCKVVLPTSWDKTLQKAFDVQFVNKENKLEYVWATSWVFLLV